MIIGISTISDQWKSHLEIERIQEEIKSEAIDYYIVRAPSLREKEYGQLLKLLLDGLSAREVNKLILHNHIDLARSLGINRVHLPEVFWKNKPWPRDLKCSISVHPPEDSLAEVMEKVTFFLMSPVLKTDSKPGAEPLPIELVRETISLNPDKAVLLGGLSKDKIGSFRELGAKHFAVKSKLNSFL